MPLNILYDHQFFPVLKYSGITRYFYELIFRLCREEGVDISLFMGFHINKFGFADLKPHLKNYWSFKRPNLAGRGAATFARINNRLLSAMSALTNPSIYHQTYYSYLLPSFKGKRILTVYDMAYFAHPERFAKDDPVRGWLRKDVAKADGIIAISESTKKLLEEYLDVPDEKIRVIYLANSLHSLVSQKPPVSEPYILYVGQRFAQKNFKTLLRAYCRSERVNREYRLVCFGGSPVTSEELSILQEFKMEGRITVTEGTDQLLAQFYQHARLLVYPSLHEGFGMPLLEAMHFGCPVLASNSTSLPEVGGEAAVYFDPQNEEELIDKLCLLCVEDDSLHKQLMEAGPLREGQFSWDCCARETLSFYRFVSDS